MYEMVMSMPNSPLTLDSKSFMTSGLKGWAEDDLSDIAPKTSQALIEDGSLCVFVKVLKSRQVEDVPLEFEAKGSDHIKESVQGKAIHVTESKSEAQEDDWGVATEAPATTQKKKSKGGKKKKGGAKKQGKEAAEVEALVGSEISSAILIE